LGVQVLLWVSNGYVFVLRQRVFAYLNRQFVPREAEKKGSLFDYFDGPFFVVFWVVLCRLKDGFCRFLIA
jgi:hypothetical protein